MNENQDYIITLNDENGNDVNFEFLDLICYEDEEYVVLLPEENNEDSNVVILKILATCDDEEDTFVGIDDTETLHAVYAIFKERFKDVFDFED